MVEEFAPASEAVPAPSHGLANELANAPAHEPMRRGALGAWWAQGTRTAVFMRPDWSVLQVSPVVLFWLLIAMQGLSLGWQRLMIDGPAEFHWQALLSIGVGTVGLAWLCWYLVPPSVASAGPEAAPSGGALFSMLAAQALPVNLLVGLLVLPVAHAEVDLYAAFGPWGTGLAMSLLLLWIYAAQVSVLWRSVPRRPLVKVAASALLLALLVAEAGHSWAQPFWDARDAALDGADSSPTDDEGPPFALTQELVELQPALMAQKLEALLPQRTQAIDVYVITFAPYAEEDVFRRESQMVAEVMAQRFEADGRSIQLMNHRDAVREWPWATPLNLQRVIRQVAQKMDREKDVLIIHLTSHGARSGELAASFWPLAVDPVTPTHLKQWLDDAGVRYRVLSISACYSGSWIAPLAGPDTLVMTAADADHTSYGCGRHSELTFFGRAMYDEQLRQTRSFERAHAQARIVIEQREKEAGKTDGYSNPQIAVGEGMREHLTRLEAQLDKSAPAR